MVNVEQGGEESISSLPDPYEIVSIRSVSAPRGSVGANWHRYEISQGRNRIVGYRAGRIETVTKAVEVLVFRLNERRRLRRGRVHVVLHSNFKAKASSSEQ